VNELEIEERTQAALLPFFFSFSRFFSSLFLQKIATAIYSGSSFNSKPKRQPAASLIKVVVPPSHGAGPHTTVLFANFAILKIKEKFMFYLVMYNDNFNQDFN
jgi:hypothetical protein